MRSLRAYTLVELLVVIGILAIIAAASISAYISLQERGSLSADSGNALAQLEEARSLSINGKNADTWGVHFASSSATLFEGASYNPAGAGNVTTSLGSSVVISGISLSGGGNDVIFDRLTGATAEPGTITLSLAASSSVSKTVTVYATGLAQAQ